MSPSPHPQRQFSHLPGDGGAELAPLLQRVETGDESALSELYRATSPMVFGLARQILRDLHLAEDATLAVFQRVWRSSGTYRADRGSPIVWLLSIARHQCIDVLRRRRGSLAADDIAALATELATSERTPFEIASEREHAEKVRNATSDLPRGQREALAAAYFGGLSQSEVATTLDVPLGTVKTRIRQALQTLRRDLDRRETEQP